MIKKVFILSFLLLASCLLSAQSAKSRWVDSVFTSLSANDKLGQIFMMVVDENIDAQTINEIESRIKSHEVGGLVFRNVHAGRQVSLVNHFQRLSKIPLLIAHQGEISSLLDSTIVFPPQLVLGAIENDTLLYRLGSVLARQYKMMGVNLVFSPVTRVSDPVFNPNPNTYSFGQDKDRVTHKSLALMRGFQDHGIISCAQYYPLKPIPLVDFRSDVPRAPAVDSVQRYPFVKLIANGLRGVAPVASETPDFYDMPQGKRTNYSTATLTALQTGEMLRRKLDFHGLTFIDVQRIETLSDKEKDGDAELYAFQTGNDVLMNPNDISAAIRKIKRLLKKEDDYEKQLDNTVRKVLEAKFEAGLWQRTQLSSDNLQIRLTHPEVRVLNERLYEASVTIVKNESDVLPLKVLENKSFAYVSGSANENNHLFFEYLKKYISPSFFLLEDKSDQEILGRSLRNFQTVIVGIFPDTPDKTIQRLNDVLSKLDNRPEVIFCDFGHPSFLAEAHRHAAVVTGYVNLEGSFKAVPQVIFGALPGVGRLPFSASAQLLAGTGVKTSRLGRLGYSVPESVRMDSRTLMAIDSIAREAIRIGATPGCQVLVARNGKVIYEKSFGHLTYEKRFPVTSETIYDLASITKVAATLQTAMFLQERGLIDLNKKVSHYLPELKTTNKKNITFIDMLTHQAGLTPFIPMYPQTMKDTMYLPQYYSRVRNEKYPLQISSNLYGSLALRDSVWSWVLRSKMADKPARTPYAYRYSDLGFMIMHRVAERLLNQPMDEFLTQHFYEPLGASTLGFNPLNRFNKQSIAPTEDDKIYRRTFVSGTVHDERAAMMGGIAGHAGLFGTANDLAKLGQMLLQGGYYGGSQFFRPETVRLFTEKKFRTSRRGIGWDKPLQSDPSSPTSLFASPETFGHTGFTGTCIWVDPRFDLVYVFLSNRVYPDRNGKLINANIRSRIQDVIYKSIFNYVDQERPAYIVNDFAINTAPSRPLK